MSESVSVVIPTYNRASDLERVLDSYLAQPEVGEVIVVDDGSIDRTPDLLGCWPAGRVPLRAVRLDTNQGQATARNVGADAARGEYIFYGEDDYTPGPSHVAVLLQHLARSGADVIAGRRVNVRRDESFGAALRRAGMYRDPLIERWAAVQNPWVDAGADVEAPLLDACSLVRRDVLRRVRFDTGFKGNGWREESDFQLSALRVGLRLVHCSHEVPEIVAGSRTSSGWSGITSASSTSIGHFYGPGDASCACRPIRCLQHSSSWRYDSDEPGENSHATPTR